MQIVLILLVVVNILSVLFIGLIYYSITNYEEKSANYFRLFNSYALAVSKSGNRPDEDILLKYYDLVEEISHLNRSGFELSAPVYTTPDEREEYSAELRVHAASVRNNLSDIIDSFYIGLGILFGLLIIVSFILLGIMFIFRHSLMKYLTEQLFGFDYLKKIIQMEKHNGFARIESNIEEIDELNEALLSLSNDVSFNMELLENSALGNLDNIMNNLYNNFSEIMSCDRIALAFIDSSNRCIAETAVTSYNNPQLRPGHRENLSSTSLPGIIESGNARIINDLGKYSETRRVSHSTNLLLKEGIKSSMTLPMMFDGKCLGFLFISSLEVNAYGESKLVYAKRVLNLLKQKLYIEFLLQEVISETSNAFVGLMEEKDNETSSHILRMSQYAYITARSYHELFEPLPPRFMREILWYAPLHDIGKVGTPDAILLKEGPLTEDEMAVMKGHVDVGIRVIEKMNESLQDVFSTPLLKTAVDIIAGHHEKYNGMGYPNGLKGDEIPLAGRIVAIADVFDALTSKRPYKKAFSIEEAIRIIENDMISSFDPRIVAAFKHGLEEIRGVYNRLKEI